MDDTGLDILSKLARLGQRKQVRLPWVPSDMGVVCLGTNQLNCWLCSSRAHQRALARFISGHLRSMSLCRGKVFLNLFLLSRPASPAHLLDCWGIALRQLFENQDRVCQIIMRKRQMELV
ncbi:hypothetical protein TNCV_1264441 [Trichonephila clavipes]|nr:hypothetical protein TNCV_1264441 [Trichonephila clavipes]